MVVVVVSGSVVAGIFFFSGDDSPLFSFVHAPLPTSHTSSAAQQCKWSEQHLAFFIGQQP